MKKLTLIEPYASFAAHPYRNYINFPRQLSKAGIAYEMVVENGLEDHENNNIRPLLTRYENLINDRASLYKKREMEYKSILTTRPGMICLFITVQREDLLILKNILKDSRTREKILNNDNIIIIHSCHIFDTYLELARELETELTELKHNLFFSFYSEFQALLLKEEVPDANTCTIYQTAYDDFFYNKDKEQKYENITYLGYFQNVKGSHIVKEVLNNLKDQSFYIHFYPITNRNMFLAAELYRIKNRNSKIVTRKMSSAEYLSAVKTASIGMVPYDPYHYAAQASGPAEEYMLSGKPVLVTEHTWSEYLLKSNNGGGLSFDGKNKHEAVEKLRDIIERYDFYKKKAIHAAEVIQKKYTISTFIEIIDKIEKTRKTPYLDEKLIKTDYAKTLNRGKAFYATEFAIAMQKRNLNADAIKYVEKALEADSSYWKANFMYGFLKAGAKRRSFILDGLAGEERIYNPIDYIEQVFHGGQKDYKADDREGVIRSIAEIEAQDYLSLEEMIILSDPEASKRIESLIGYIDVEMSSGENHEMRRLAETIYYAAGDYFWKNNNEKWKRCFKKAVHLYKVKKELTFKEVYNLASALKKLGRFINSKKEFHKIIVSCKEENLLSGAYFHCGEIELRTDNIVNALHLFQQCLKINPGHSKARQYLSELKNPVKESNIHVRT